MSNYSINFEEINDPGDMERLSQMLNIIGDSDQLMIAIDKDDLNEGSEILKVLHGNGFSIIAKSSDSENKYNFIVRRR